MRKAPAPTKTQGAFEGTGSYFVAFRRLMKAFLVVAALRGWLPYIVADWLVQQGGLSNV